MQHSSLSVDTGRMFSQLSSQGMFFTWSHTNLEMARICTFDEGSAIFHNGNLFFMVVVKLSNKNTTPPRAPQSLWSRERMK